MLTNLLKPAFFVHPVRFGEILKYDAKKNTPPPRSRMIGELLLRMAKYCKMVEKCIDTVKKSDHFDLTRAGEVHKSF